jgi:hypothetical protein
MKMVIVSIKDTAADAFGRPAFVATEGVALRQFQDEVNRASEDNQLYKHPQDFHLYYIGMFDDSTGKFELMEIPKLITRGTDVIMKETV